MKDKKDIKKLIEIICKKSQNASKKLIAASPLQKNKALFSIANAINNDSKKILFENLKDLNNATKNKLSRSMIDRLMLNEGRIKDIVEGVKLISKLPDPVGKEIKKWTRPNGLNISQISVPIGVIGIIYESRPNVTADASALSLKSGNTIILRGGSESFNSSRAIVKSIKKGLKNTFLPPESVQMIETIDRKAVGLLLSMNKYIDLIIPRGGKSLISKIQTDSKIPTLSHLDGLCHTYIDVDADEKKSNKYFY